MQIEICPSSDKLAEAAAKQAATILQNALAKKPEVNVIVATGNSQLTFLDCLARTPGLDWSRTVFFHLDEYVGLPPSHPASFRKYLRERVDERLKPKEFHYVDADQPDPHEVCRRLGALISTKDIDVAFVGVGENGHLAFNDPPADFDTTAPYLVVALDGACRRQQVNEGWFKTLDDVPRQAISMSIRQILKSQNILCIVPEERKAPAIRDCFGDGVSNLHPASILQTHPRCTVFLDPGSSSLLPRR